ncbi:MAG TPA: transaldolase family protein [Spirochaetia bacterium]|nr:transaldolase family protein [Spirochaetia bacterium]
MTELAVNTVKTIRDFILSGIDMKRPAPKAPADAFWAGLLKAGTEIWLDTGDIDAARKQWTAEMTALTTNNTLLNREIQKGIYDDFIKEADGILKDLDRKERIVEIAFILNARHGLRLVQEFGGRVSVELHTDLANDLEGIVAYGRRFHEISPDRFIVKVPLTATGLLGARKLRELSIPVNFTLEFSARQNVLATVIAKPNYCNVFLGRLNAFVADNDLGTGDWVGEKTTIASQRAIRMAGEGLREPTKQIAASLRSGQQLESLAGVDVFTMPTKVAAEGHETIKSPFRDRTSENYEVELRDSVDPTEVRIDCLWEVDDALLRFAGEIDANPPKSGRELEDRAHRAGYGELFPHLTAVQLETVAKEGKVPVHRSWKGAIERHEVAVDTLLNLAGLASFTADQAEMDKRVSGLIR